MVPTDCPCCGVTVQCVPLLRVVRALLITGLFYMLLIFCGLAFVMVGLENAVIRIGRRQATARHPPSC